MKRNELIEELLNFISGNSRENYDNWKTMKDSFMDEFKKFYNSDNVKITFSFTTCTVSKTYPRFGYF